MFVLIKTNCSLGISCWNPIGKKLLWKFDFGSNINKFEFILLPQIWSSMKDLLFSMDFIKHQKWVLLGTACHIDTAT